MGDDVGGRLGGERLSVGGSGADVGGNDEQSPFWKRRERGERGGREEEGLHYIW